MKYLANSFSVAMKISSQKTLRNFGIIELPQTIQNRYDFSGKPSFINTGFPVSRRAPYNTSPSYLRELAPRRHGVLFRHPKIFRSYAISEAG